MPYAVHQLIVCLASCFGQLEEDDQSDHSTSMFDFGKNWGQFVDISDGYALDHPFGIRNRLLTSRSQLISDFQLGDVGFSGLSFVDIGCGSGLHSAAAHSLNAAQILSVDVMEGSVNATSGLRARVRADTSNWRILQNTILEAESWRNAEQFDAVYAWGSLHHTGNVWKAIKNALRFVSSAGRIFLALYPHEDMQTHDDWLDAKQQYMSSMPIERKLMVFAYLLHGIYDDVVEKANRVEQVWKESGRSLPMPEYLRYMSILKTVDMKSKDHTLARGMDMFTDAEDWMGGYPMEWVLAVDVCQTLNSAGFYPLQLDLTNGMLFVLAGRNESELPPRRALPGPFQKTRKGCWRAVIPVMWPVAVQEASSPLRMFEDDACLGAPYGSKHQDVLHFCDGPGRYEHLEGQVLFQTSDKTDPNTNGRRYSVVVPDDWEEDQS